MCPWEMIPWEHNTREEVKKVKMSLMEKDSLWSHIHREQFKKVIEDEVFEKRKKSQMGLRFFI
jgi:hypothetical protein